MWTQVSTGWGHTCGLDAVGQAYCWGLGDSGQLGGGATADSTEPVAVDASGVLAGKTLTQVTAGGYHTCVLDSAGRAYCWGFGESGQLGSGSTSGSTVPVAVTVAGVLAGKTLAMVSAGAYHTCGPDTVGRAYCWGWGEFGELGNGSTSDSTVPVAVIDP